MPVPSDLLLFEEAGRTEKTSYSFYRGEHTSFHPTDKSFEQADIIDKMVRGMVPERPIIDKQTSIVAFGSCFAENISNYLHGAGYNVATKKDRIAYISIMGDGLVNTFSLLQQFEWGWQGKQPKGECWHGYDAKAFGYDEEIRLATKAMLDTTDVFIITLGLSEVWYDALTGDVFWRAVPKDKYEPDRHKFRTVTHAENLMNIQTMVWLIRRYRPQATIIFTISPITLAATFRPISCIAANCVSKAVLRSALDEYMHFNPDPKVFYFPSYEIVLNCFNHPWMEDRRHVHKHVIDFIMRLFETYYCGGGESTDLHYRFQLAQVHDRMVALEGHWSVPRNSLRFAKP